MPRPEIIGYEPQHQSSSPDRPDALVQLQRRLAALAERKAARQQQIETALTVGTVLGTSELPYPRPVLELRERYMRNEQVWDDLMNLLHIAIAERPRPMRDLARIVNELEDTEVMSQRLYDDYRIAARAARE